MLAWERWGLDIFLRKLLNIYMAQTKAHQKLHKHHNWMILCSVVLIILLGVVVLKYKSAKNSWYGNSVTLQQGIQSSEANEAINTGKLIAVGVGTVPAANPLYKQSEALQDYIVDAGNNTGKYIVVVNKDKVILADTLSGNVGETYNSDVNGEIGKTMFDGTPRTFIEKSSSFPNGTTLQVVQMKDAAGAIIGAVLVSTSSAMK